MATHTKAISLAEASFWKFKCYVLDIQQAEKERALLNARIDEMVRDTKVLMKSIGLDPEARYTLNEKDRTATLAPR